ncbi:hypothetical protein F4819DRAFT_451488 [Hypoxylon fuscum]|nr:hypothetical protein F4819DRAFT_451488 [Hypoxylon fuscum]
MNLVLICWLGMSIARRDSKVVTCKGSSMLTRLPAVNLMSLLIPLGTHSETSTPKSLDMLNHTSSAVSDSRNN